MTNRPKWPHAPHHRLCAQGTYFFTASTYNKVHHFKTRKRLDVLQRGLLSVTAEYGWRLEAWAVFSNHYHFVAHAPEQGREFLPRMFTKLHTRTARWINELDGSPGRTVWHNYWDSQITNHGSYLARLNYVHQNAVRHGLVPVAAQYPWCSAAWFEQTARGAQVKQIYSVKWDTLKVMDDYQPLGLDAIT